jgi:hypothetical protein
MGKVSYRLDDARAKKLAEAFAFLGYTSDNATQNHIALLDMIFDVIENRKNSQTISEGLAKHESQKIDIACNCRISVKKLVRALDKEGQPCWEERPVCYCVQGQGGKLKKQLKLESLDACEICKLFQAKWIEEQQTMLGEIQESTSSPKPLPAITMPEMTPPLPITESSAPQPVRNYKKFLHYVRNDGGKFCPYDGSLIYKWNCINCEKHHPAKYQACVLLHLEKPVANTPKS